MNALIDFINSFRNPNFEQEAKEWDAKCQRMNPQEEAKRYEEYLKKLGNNF